MADPIYIDTSCLLKLVISEPESPHVEEIVARRDHVVVSTLGELEAKVQLGALWQGGRVSLAMYRKLLKRLDNVIDMEPFEQQTLSGGVFDAALLQLEKRTVHCRTLDRLHLAAMDFLGMRHLLTNDDQQAAAARALGFTVTLPR